MILTCSLCDLPSDPQTPPELRIMRKERKAFSARMRRCRTLSPCSVRVLVAISTKPTRTRKMSCSWARKVATRLFEDGHQRDTHCYGQLFGSKIRICGVFGAGFYHFEGRALNYSTDWWSMSQIEPLPWPLVPRYPSYILLMKPCPHWKQRLPILHWWNAAEIGKHRVNSLSRDFMHEIGKKSGGEIIN